MRMVPVDGAGLVKIAFPWASPQCGPSCLDEMRSATASRTYDLFARAMAEHKQVLCSYNGRKRVVCPVVLGHSDGREVALTFQIAGESRTSLPRGGNWRCLELAKVRNMQLRDGPWHVGSSHRRPQTCVEIVDLDVNPSSPYSPRRRL